MVRGKPDDPTYPCFECEIRRKCSECSGIVKECIIYDLIEAVKKPKSNFSNTIITKEKDSSQDEKENEEG